uniref:AAA+ ATPase domain-containing protein n=1 Tax=Glossina pallidipes TaxID=7398 RepID=A0A1A9ZLK8_GLOPL
MSRNEEIRNLSIRHKNILYLIQRYLSDNGLFATAKALLTEARLNEEFELCDNIDLDSIYLEYATYHQLKFGKYPKFLRKIKEPIKLDLAQKRNKIKAKPVDAEVNETGAETARKRDWLMMDVNDLKVTVTKIDTPSRDEQVDSDTLPKKHNVESLASLREVQHGNNIANGDLLLSCQEWQNLADMLRSTIVHEDVILSWGDMCGNSACVEIIKEAVLTPLKYPQLFANGLKPWRSVLLHGPPGSGKTMLAKVLYAETKEKVTFFNITSSMIVSKWRGESEKLLKILFYLAQKHAPSIIFLDEIEGLTSKRDRVTDHESSKRFKNELLQLMDGLEQSSSGVFILASTNLPWEIDEAFLRRFEKKLLVQLPNELERAKIINKLLPINVQINETTMCNLVKISANFTGDEIRLACKEIAMQAVRRVTQIAVKGKAETELLPDLAFTQVKPLSNILMEKHVKWQKEHGS